MRPFGSFKVLLGGAGLQRPAARLGTNVSQELRRRECKEDSTSEWHRHIPYHFDRLTGAGQPRPTPRLTRRGLKPAPYTDTNELSPLSASRYSGIPSSSSPRPISELAGDSTSVLMTNTDDTSTKTMTVNG